MVVINLFPWRKQQLHYQKKIMKYALIITVLFNVFLLTSSHAFLLNWIEHLKMVNANLQRDLQKAQEKRTTLEASFTTNALIENMLASQRATEVFFKKLDNEMHDVCFTEISKLNHIVNFSGVASSTFDLMNFLQSWPVSHLFSEIQVEQLQQQENGMRFQFKAIEDRA